MKITPRALACIALLPFTSLISEAKNEWVSSDRDSTYTITANSEHLVQDRSVVSAFFDVVILSNLRS